MTQNSLADLQDFVKQSKIDISQLKSDMEYVLDIVKNFNSSNFNFLDNFKKMDQKMAKIQNTSSKELDKFKEQLNK